MARAARAVIFPVLSEATGLPIIEAIACGTPVAAAAVGGVPEILGDDAPACLVTERSAVAWRDALRGLLEASIAPERARRYAFRFAWDEVVTRQCALYERVVAANGSAPSRTARLITSCG